MQSGSRLSILLVEADADTRDMYTEYLALSGFDVVGVASGEDALSRAVDADIVVTGLRVPAIDGLQIVRRLRQEERTKQKVLIVLTACVSGADRQSALAAGCDVFLAKPCSPETLVAELRRAVALRCVSQPAPLRAGDQPTDARAGAA